MSKASSDGGLQRLLDLADELRALKRRIQDPGLKAETAQRLRRRSKEKLCRLATELETHRFGGPLRHLHRKLEPEHFLMIATLLRRHLRSTQPWMEGRALLAAIFDSSFEMLKGLELLQPESILRSEDLILMETDEEEEVDLLEARFRLAPSLVEAFLEEMGLRGRRRGARLKGYANQREYLVDLKVYHNLHLARARRVFHPDRWWRLRGGAVKRACRALDRRIQNQGSRIHKRLAKTEEPKRFPLLRFIDEFKLSEPEVLIVLHLLFLELLEGNPYADGVQVLQLVSGSEEELLRNRELLMPFGTLRKKGILELEEMLEGRELTSEVYLGDWVLDRIFGSDAQQDPIGVDERLEFHLYLKKLEGSNFLNDL